MDIAFTTVDPALRTRAFARVIGPFVAAVTGIIAVCAGYLSFLGDSFFKDPMWSWLFGWFLVLRGFVMLAFPQLMQKGVDASIPAVGPVRVFFLCMAAVGLYLTYVGWIRKR